MATRRVLAELATAWQVRGGEPVDIVSFGSSAMAVQAALDGVGVLVAQLPYVSGSLASGRLVAPFGTPRRRYESWYLAFRAVRAENAVLSAFREWLRDEGARQRDKYPIEARLVASV